LPETESAEKAVITVGSYLREVRESKGIELEEAARVTRIGQNYLVAIEGNTFDKLPSTAYVKGFLRVYAGYLGLSGDDVVAMLDKSLNAQQTQPSRDADKDVQRRRNKAATSMPGWWLVPLVLLGAVVVTAYIIGDKEEKTNKEPKERPSASAGAQVATRTAPVLPPRS
jgi:cytoskeleton protein RodZ